MSRKPAPFSRMRPVAQLLAEERTLRQAARTAKAAAATDPTFAQVLAQALNQSRPSRQHAGPTHQPRNHA